MYVGDAGQSSVAAAARSDAEEEAGRGSTEGVVRPDARDEIGRVGTEDAAQPRAGGDAGRGDAVDAARSGAEEGETGGDASEHPTSQTEGEVLIHERAKARDEGAAVAVMVQTAPAVEVSTEVTQAAAAPAEATPGAEAPAAMETPAEDPWEATVAAAASASEGDADTWWPRRPVREGTWVMVQPGIPSTFDHKERTKIESWEGYDQAKYDIERSLAFALDIHRGFHLQVGDVSTVLQLVPLCFCGFLLTSFHLQWLKQKTCNKSDELAHQFTRAY